jgi:hypothetical protein
MKQKSAVEWLEKKLIEAGLLFEVGEAIEIEQAKEMEKQQMWEYIKTNYVIGENSLLFHKQEFEQYYAETYGK